MAFLLGIIEKAGMNFFSLMFLNFFHHDFTQLVFSHGRAVELGLKSEENFINLARKSGKIGGLCEVVSEYGL